MFSRFLSCCAISLVMSFSFPFVSFSVQSSPNPKTVLSSCKTLEWPSGKFKIAKTDFLNFGFTWKNADGDDLFLQMFLNLWPQDEHEVAKKNRIQTATKDKHWHYNGNKGHQMATTTNTNSGHFFACLIFLNSGHPGNSKKTKNKKDLACFFYLFDSFKSWPSPKRKLVGRVCLFFFWFFWILAISGKKTGGRGLFFLICLMLLFFLFFFEFWPARKFKKNTKNKKKHLAIFFVVFLFFWILAISGKKTGGMGLFFFLDFFDFFVFFYFFLILASPETQKNQKK